MSQYFYNLNYTLANEDTGTELKIIPPTAKRVAAVNGSGSRSLPFLRQPLTNLWTIDISKEQLLLARLRWEAIRSLPEEQFAVLFGYLDKDDGQALQSMKERLFKSLKLPEDVRSYFTEFFAKTEWQPLIYQGRWEKTFRKLQKVNHVLTGTKGAAVFECRDLVAQSEYMEKWFPHFRWDLVLRFLGSATIFNALLYKGHFPKANVSKNMLQFYRDSFTKLFSKTAARENFFLQLCFLGRVAHREAWPVEMNTDVYQSMQKSNCNVEFKQGNLISTIQTAPFTFDYVSLSDVPSYFAGETERNFLQDIRPHVSVKGLVVLRSYRHRPEQMNTTGYKNVTERYRDAIDHEKVGVYVFDVFEKN